MAKDCPKCSRPNSDEALRCIYCGEVFPDAPSPVRASKPDEKPPGPESYLVVVSPVKEIKGEWVKGLKHLTNWDSYLVKQRLRITSPWIARNFQDSQDAQRFIQGLIGLGLDAYLVKQSGLAKLEQKLMPRGMRMTEGGMVFIFEGGEEFSFKYDSLFLLVRGRLKPEHSEKPDDEDSDRVSLGVLFGPDMFAEDDKPGDDPLERLRERLGRIKVKRRFITKRPPSMQSEAQVMDIYFRGSHRGIRVIENEFDFSGMGDLRTDSSMLNFNVLLRMLLEKAPHVYYDDEFKKISYTMKASKEGESRRLDLLPGSGKGGAAKKLYSSKDSFTDYSSRIYLYYLRKASSKSG